MSILECNYEEKSENPKHNMQEVLTEEISRESRTNLLLELIQKKLQKGKSLEVIADETEQPIEVITNLINSLKQDDQVTDK